MEPMPKPRYQYVQKQTTRHGKITWYFRIGDGPRTRMPGKYGDDEFVAMWKSLMAGVAIEKQPVGKHTFEWLVSKYEASADFKLLKVSTQRFRSNVLKNVCKTGGKLLVAQVTRQIIAAGRDRRAATPFAAINYLKIMNYIFDWAVDAEYATFNPARDVKRPKAKSEGHTPWTEEDVIAFYKQHPAGSQARLAMEILLFTGLRRSDAYLIGPQHVRDDVIEFRATKNDEQLFIALHPILKASLARVKPGHMAYLVTPVQGQPFRSAASFGNWFGKVCRQAGVTGRAHGIRKSLAQRLAERGGSNQELKALFGWTSDAMATLYTKKADRRKMAMSAAAKLNENILSPHPETGEGMSDNNAAKSNT